MTNSNQGAEARQVFKKLVNEAQGFLSMADASVHGVTNIRVLQQRIDDARAALAESAAPQDTELLNWLIFYSARICIHESSERVTIKWYSTTDESVEGDTGPLDCSPREAIRKAMEMEASGDVEPAAPAQHKVDEPIDWQDDYLSLVARLRPFLFKENESSTDDEIVERVKRVAAPSQPSDGIIDSRSDQIIDSLSAHGHLKTANYPEVKAIVVNVLKAMSQAAPSQDAPLPEIKRLQAIIERDRTQVSMGVTAMRNVLQGREWLTEGRGPYEWNDDNWHKEFAAASDEMYEALKPLEKIAADLSDSPKTQIEVDSARGAAPSSARTDKDYAIEHGGYLADAAQAYLDEKNRYDAAVAGYGDEIPDTDSLTDHHQALRSRIYEFRKRAQKATERPSSAGTEPPQCPSCKSSRPRFRKCFTHDFIHDASSLWNTHTKCRLCSDPWHESEAAASEGTPTIKYCHCECHNAGQAWCEKCFESNHVHRDAVTSLDGGARQAFAKLLKKVAEKNPAGVSDVWIDAAKFGWEAALDYAFGKAAEEARVVADGLAKLHGREEVLDLEARLRQMQGKS